MEEAIRVQLEEIKEADLLIGIPSLNNSSTIGLVVREIAAGIGRYFPKARAILINSDGGSTDGSQEEVKKAQTDNLKIVLVSHSVPPVHKIVPPYHGIPGKENALRTIFEAVHSLKARACAVFDPSLRSITAEWVHLLLRPILEESFDYVAPLYTRHPFEGTITNSIIYPLTRALYGQRIRQPIAGDFGFSGELAKFFLSKKVGENEVSRLGVDLWITTLAITAGCRVGQSFLGPRIQNAKDAGSDLGSMFTQVVSTAFRLMEDHQTQWQETRETQPVPTFGRWDENPEPISFNVERMIANFRLGARALTEIWRKVLAPEAVRRLGAINRMSDADFSFPQDLWVRVIYDFAVGFHRELVHRDHLLKSMIPLYLGWVASFLKENRQASPKEVEEKIESLCQVFEQMKAYLRERWG